MNEPNRTINRRDFLAFIGAVGLVSTGCSSEGNFRLLGYTTKPNYDCSIRTVYVPILQNKTFQTTTSREAEMELTRAIIREIELKTPYKVVSNPEKADTELLATLVRNSKGIANRNQQNEVREIEQVLAIEIVWRDLRSGKVLSNPRTRSTEVIDMGFDKSITKPETGPEKAQPVVITSTGRALPEAGESNTTAQQMAINRMAVKVAQMMESPWELAAKECPR